MTRCPPRLEQSRVDRAVQCSAEQSRATSQPASPPASTYYPFHAPRRRVCQPLTYGPHGFLYYLHPAAASFSSPLLSLLCSPLSFPLPSFLFLSPPPPGGRWVNCGLEHGTPTLGIGDFDSGTSRTRTSTSWRCKNKREGNQRRGFQQSFVNGDYCHRL